MNKDRYAVMSAGRVKQITKEVKSRTAQEAIQTIEEDEKANCEWAVFVRNSMSTIYLMSCGGHDSADLNISPLCENNLGLVTQAFEDLGYKVEVNGYTMTVSWA